MITLDDIIEILPDADIVDIVITTDEARAVREMADTVGVNLVIDPDRAVRFLWANYRGRLECAYWRRLDEIVIVAE